MKTFWFCLFRFPKWNNKKTRFANELWAKWLWSWIRLVRLNAVKWLRLFNAIFSRYGCDMILSLGQCLRVWMLRNLTTTLSDHQLISLTSQVTTYGSSVSRLVTIVEVATIVIYATINWFLLRPRPVPALKSFVFMFSASLWAALEISFDGLRLHHDSLFIWLSIFYGCSRGCFSGIQRIKDMHLVSSLRRRNVFLSNHFTIQR